MRSRIVLFVFLMVGLVQAGSYRETFEKSYKLSSGGELILDNANGSVTIESWDRDEVKIEAEKIVKSGNRRRAEEIMAQVKIDIEHDDDFIRIETRHPRKNKGFWDKLFEDGVNVSVTYRLIVPRRLNLDVKTVNGRVDVSDIAGRIKLRSTNGKIRLSEAVGAVDVKTTNGGIDVELLDVYKNQEMAFKTTNGGITVHLPEDFRADVDAKTTNGSIKIDFPVEVRGDLSRKRLRGKINGGGATMVLHTTNGGIRLYER